ncbi:MAG: ABC transporter ATP-binding protein [Candidatus Pristimantibacillus lignocellulolyticus]|uniref:ABC transporter ATP-binding protein n=1 Tax=Candidatus Pristimantibacillus lignocellulolyticus TaxID=2994561 RepID=A0A9J6ZKJ7_9BACL|nr:MAG: ABC transporter ATP-binding protein [Candidatus Pristimantibacillus lignocellulolyticus]
METNKISFQYKNSPPILNELSTSIAEGKVTTIIGPNGSGKSTLLALLARNYIPSVGQIIIDGRDLQQLKTKELARILAVVHQQNDAPYDLTVEKLVEYGRLPYRHMFSSESNEDREAIEWALECTKLTEFRHRRLNELSGGQKQRAWVAMALAQKTSILFLDEPTTFLDIYYQIELLDLVQQLNREHGLTIVMVLHDVNQAVRYSDHIKVLKDGNIIAEGEPEAIMTSELMELVYDVKAVIRKDEETGLYIVPIATNA